MPVYLSALRPFQDQADVLTYHKRNTEFSSLVFSGTSGQVRCSTEQMVKANVELITEWQTCLQVFLKEQVRHL